MGANTVVVQEWLESERGWGTRPDGYSLHLSEEDRKEYIAAYWEIMPDHAPNEYSRPTGDPFLRDVEPSTITALEEARKEGVCGLRIYLPETIKSFGL